MRMHGNTGEGTGMAEGRQPDYLPGFSKDFLLPLYDIVQRWLGVPALHRLLIEQADMDHSRSTLEVGCGTGNLSILASRLHPSIEIVGVDPDLRALARAKRKAGPGSTVQFDHGYAQELPYPDTSFDRVLSAFMFHHLDAGVKARMLRETLRVLKPEGKLYLVDFGGRVTSSDGFMARLQLRSAKLRDNMGERILELLRDAGFPAPEQSIQRKTRVGSVTYYRATRSSAP